MKGRQTRDVPATSCVLPRRLRGRAPSRAAAVSRAHERGAPRSRARLLALVVAALACGCGPRAAPAAPGLGTPIPVPAEEPSQPCADVGARRACWSAARVATLVPRRLPARPASSPLGWRCAWPGRARLCVDRRADAPPFSCAGARCTQAHARRPDDGEWTCVDTAGAEVCLSLAPAAGVAAAPPDPAWICGPRRGAKAGAAEASARVCVDLAPDVPDGDGAGWRCRAVDGPPPARICERGPSSGAVGVACDRARPCVDGAVCASGRCVPARPAPSCWLDDDCPGGACRFGTCFDEAAP
jgi:hypothetical protein